MASQSKSGGKISEDTHGVHTCESTLPEGTWTLSQGAGTPEGASPPPRGASTPSQALPYNSASTHSQGAGTSPFITIAFTSSLSQEPDNGSFPEPWQRSLTSQ